MKIYGVVFSPTGGSYKVLSSLIDGIRTSAVCEAEIIDVTRRDEVPVNFGADDMVVLCAPVYGGRMPRIAKARMDEMAGHNTPCVLIAVYGNRAFEDALCDMADFATMHGFVTVGAAAFVGEHSYSTSVTPIAVGRPDAIDIKEAFDLGLKLGTKYGCGRLKSVDVASLHDEPSPEQSLANFHDFVMRYQEQQKNSPKQYLPEVDLSKCSECGECVAVCPVHAISDDCHVVDATICIKCCACVKFCPSGARSLSSPFAPVLSANFSARKKAVWIFG